MELGRFSLQPQLLPHPTFYLLPIINLHLLPHPSLSETQVFALPEAKALLVTQHCCQPLPPLYALLSTLFRAAQRRRGAPTTLSAAHAHPGRESSLLDLTTKTNKAKRNVLPFLQMGNQDQRYYMSSPRKPAAKSGTDPLFPESQHSVSNRTWSVFPLYLPVGTRNLCSTSPHVSFALYCTQPYTPRWDSLINNHMWTPALLLCLSTHASLTAQELVFPSCIPSVIIIQTFLWHRLPTPRTL